uniref:3'-5' exonuclease domain-containing protein n=1 Tax=Oryza brachyantha TaxID=4533 RepID=J3MI43_ORYBR
MLSAYYDLHVASGRELRSMASMGNASMEAMADRFLGYPGIDKPMNVAMSGWHVPYLSIEQVQYACVDAYLAFRLAVHLSSAHQLVPAHAPPPPPARRAPVYLHAPLPPGPRVAVLAPPPAQRALVRPRAPPPSAPVYRAVPRAEHAAQTNWALVSTAVDVDDDASESENSSNITDSGRPRAAASDSDIDEEYSSSYAASDGHAFSSDDFELMGHGMLSSDEEDGYAEFVLGMGGLNLDIDSDDDNDDDEGYNGNASIGIVTLQSYDEYGSIGIVTLQSYQMAGNEEMFVRNGGATLEELEDDIVAGAGPANVEEGGGGGGGGGEIARAAAANGVPAALQRFLADNGVAFVGYGVRSDCRKLAAHHEGVRVACTRELRSVTGMGNASMERMAEELLGLAGMKKPVTVSRSRWDAPKLSKKQVKYACVDAFLSLRLGVHVGVTPSSSSD